ncbi:MAG: MgtC/SapB family protein [bacterium]|nr:MgtC/SapB family protein [bacterium]
MTFFIDQIDANAIFVIRLLVALLLGGLVGLERQTRGRPAGMRTNILVCLGSAAVIVAFQKLSMEMSSGAESAIRMDPARAAAGVITGIGFLGAGTIVKSKSFVRGLTTAASIWVVSAVGVTVGLGEYVIAFVLTLLVLISLFVLHFVPVRADHYSTLYLDWHGDPKLLDEVVAQLDDHKVRHNQRSMNRQPNTGKCRAVFNIRYRDRDKVDTAFNRLLSDTRFDEVAWS